MLGEPPGEPGITGFQVHHSFLSNEPYILAESRTGEAEEASQGGLAGNSLGRWDGEGQSCMLNWTMH